MAASTEENKPVQDKSVDGATSTAPSDEQTAVAAAKETPAEEAPATAATPPAEPDAIPLPIQNLVILPPKQKTSLVRPVVESGGDVAVHTKNDPFTEAADFSLPLPPIRPEEPLQSLRIALSEVIGFSHFTNYRFEVEGANATTDGAPSTTTTTNTSKTPLKTNTAPALISPFTGSQALICLPAQVQSLDQAPCEPLINPVLDELAEIQSISGLKNGSAFRIVLERYDAASVKEHVLRLRHMLDGNIPSVTSLLEDDSASANATNNGEKNPPDGNGSEGDAINNKKMTLPALPILASVQPQVPNLADFFYRASGEEPSEYLETPAVAVSSTTPLAAAAATKPQENSNYQNHSPSKGGKRKKNKSAGEKLTSKADTEGIVESQEDSVEVLKQKIVRLNEIEEQLHLPVTVQYSRYHPPPSFRRLVGDIAYLEITVFSSVPSNGNSGESSAFQQETWQITASITGFYVNKTSTTTGKPRFDPTPSDKPCFSHTLLDCLLRTSVRFSDIWKEALGLSRERADLLIQTSKGAFATLFRQAIRGDLGGFTDPAIAMSSSFALDATLGTPSWVVPMPRAFVSENSWNRNRFHTSHPYRADEDIAQTCGVDVRTGGSRDWNEELQMAREAPTSTLYERLERARSIHKVMTEFGEASLVAVKAISDGLVVPMNPNEGTRTHVFLHNNIFVSRALDVGPETFRLVKGDRAAKKSSSREIHCIKTFHRMDKPGFYNLATVLIDYLGNRFICQSILPGILTGDKSHSILLGSVDVELPLKCDDEFQDILKEKVGEALNLLTRPVYCSPLTEERREECKQLKKASLQLAGMKTDSKPDDVVDRDATMMTCAPLETKGIKGSDKRIYVLDFGRMTPRDANWVPEGQGGTGRWEDLGRNGSSGATTTGGPIPSTLEDDEWTMNVLRPELVNQWIRSMVGNFIDQKRKEAEAKRAEIEKAGGSENEKREIRTQITEEEQRTLTDSLRLNVNVFLPDVRVVDAEQMKADEEKAREAAIFLWDDVMPRINQAIRERSISQIPTDGRSLTEFLHRNGVNCRYLGRMAMLARDEEERDAKTKDDLKNGRLTVFSRRTMPLSWLELLECEMVARAAKHVLDSYLLEQGGVAGAQPAQTVSSFLSALVSEREETAAQTENRLQKRASSEPDEEDLEGLTIFDTGGDGDAVPSPTRSRYEIWQDIEVEIGRRFRYVLSIFNRGNKSGRALHIPLLRRFCQRSGIRLAAKNYDVGGRCYTEGNTVGGRLTASYPISPVDIIDVLPMMKHTAAFHEGFAPCSVTPTLTTPPLQISLQDAKIALERAHLQFNGRGLSRALELAQEAAALYQRVTENGAHPGIVECVELMASIFLEANDPALAVSNSLKCLGIAIQGGGFDGPNVFHIHMSLFQMLFAARQFDGCVKHLKAALFLLELSAGPRHVEHYDALHKLGVIYSQDEYEGEYSSIAVAVFRELENRDPHDRLLEGFTLRSLARSLAASGEYREAVEMEKRANRAFSRFITKDHSAMKESDKDLKMYTELAVKKGNKSEVSKKLQEQKEIADAIAADLVAEEEDSSRKKKQQQKKKKGGKK